MPDTTKKLFQVTPRDWRDHDEVIVIGAMGQQVIASKGEAPSGASTMTWRRLFVEVDGDPAAPDLRDAVFYGLGIGRPAG